MPHTVRASIKPVTRLLSALLILCTLLVASPLRVHAAGVTTGHFYPATVAADTSWSNSTSNARPPKTVTFPGGTTAVAFYFEYNGAKKKVSTYKILIYGAGGTLVSTGGPFTAQNADGLVMRTVSGPGGGAFSGGSYHAVLQFAGTTNLSTNFVVSSGTSSGKATTTAFYPATKSVFDSWSNSTNNTRPAKSLTFPARTSVVAFYFEYDGAKKKVSTYKILVYNAAGTLIGTGGPYTAQYSDGLVMRTVTGPKDGPYANGTYHAVLHFAGAPDLTTTFSVGSHAVSVGLFFAATKAAYDAWGAANSGRPKQSSSFSTGTTAIGFYFEYSNASTKTDNYQVVIRNQKGALVTSGSVHTFAYADGEHFSLLGLASSSPFPNGSYRGDLVVNTKVVNSIFFSVGTPAKAQSCKATDYIATCLEPSILRLHADLPDNMAAEGTGFVIRSDSTGTYLLTNKHVVEGATPKVMKAYTSDGGTYYPVLGIARNSAATGTAGDLAVVKLPPTSLRPLTWGNSDTLTLLQQVISIGYGDAFDLPGPPTVTQGSISAVHRDLGDGFGPVWIQHQSFINHGNSGGPLLDSTYHVVGVNTLSFKDTQGIFFAIPSNYAQTVANTLIAKLVNGQ